MGLNAIETYVPWNFHTTGYRQYTFDTPATNLSDFLAAAAENNLMVLLRPGPYICGEWDFGGLPWWLASKKVAHALGFRA